MPERDLIDELLQAKVKSKLFGGQHAPRLGRLLILEPLGSGGMGTVFAAYDPRLDRKVAVKLLRGEKSTSARTLREARMLGKLNHPNVVAVYDATETDGVISIVMELAPGESLRTWVEAERPWRDVVRVMQQVAEGLAAAHHAGIVHRDIKPDNVVIGPDRARLVDFGLASTPVSDADGLSGTPSYMAPEVLGGAPANEASDQFSFGVTLFEALYGKRPHTAKSQRELREAATRAASATPDRERGVPGWLHRVVTRALAADPASRFPSLDALARELDHDRRLKRRTLALGAAIVALAVAFGYQRGAVRDLCGDGRARVEAAFPADSVQAMRASMGDAPWAQKAVDDFVALTGAWEQSHRRVCEATRVQGGQPESMLELRMRCLDRRFDRMRALRAALGSKLAPDARENLSAAIAALPHPERCESLVDASELALPDDAEQRARVKQAEQDLDRAWAAYSLGRYHDAQKLVEALSKKNIAFPPFRAAFLLLSASIEARVGNADEARQRLDAALQDAAGAHAASLEVEIWTRLLKNELFGGNAARVVEWAPFARAAAARAKGGSAEIDGIEAEARRNAGDYRQARTLLTRALASSDELRGDQRALLEMNLGSVELASGRPSAAESAFKRALSLAEAALGTGHPGLGLYYDKQASAARARGRISFAMARHERALKLRQSVYGSEDRSVATTLLRRAQTLIAAGKIAAAERDLERARAIRVRVYGERNRRVGEIDRVRGDAAAARGDSARAAQLHANAAKLDPPNAAGRELSTDSARALAERVASLPEGAETERQAGRLLAAWRARGDDVAPAFSNAAAFAQQSVGHAAQAAKLYQAALGALSDEPSVERLRAQSGLSECTEGDRKRAAARAALKLLDAMPELDASARPRLERAAQP